MAGEEKKVIVIKKITEAGHGAHGGGWKVAFADFMTAMMCFFLVMWLLNQSEETKKQVASYFSGPSMIEHQFTSYGAELTLEKLFLDLVNQPMKTIQEFMQPADFTPNLMAMGSKKVVLHYIAEELGSIASNVEILSDSVSFEISEKYFFEAGSADPAAMFIPTMKKLQQLTQGLEYSVVKIRGEMHYLSGSLSPSDAEWVAKNRVDIIQNKIASTMEHPSNQFRTSSIAIEKPIAQSQKSGVIKIEIRQKEALPEGKSVRKLEGNLEAKSSQEDLYRSYVEKQKSKK